MAAPSPAFLACLGDPYCVGYIKGAVKASAEGYGAASIIVGAALPIVVANVAISISRIIRSKRNYRAYILLVGSLAMVVTAAEIAQSVLVYEGKTKTTVSLGLGFWIIGHLALVIAGTIRFSIPLTMHRYQQIYIGFSTVMIVAFGIALLTVGLGEINTWTLPSSTPQAFSKKMAILCLILPIYYGFSGLVCFSYQLNRSLRNAPIAHSRSGVDKVASLELANHVMMALTLTIVAVYLGCFSIFKADTKLDSPTALLFNCLFIMCENAFESITNVVHEAAVSSLSRSSLKQPNSYQTAADAPAPVPVPVRAASKSAVDGAPSISHSQSVC
ncbi:uncharacterized protein SPPG_06396 [Spizellomyces punctatus DAOM BR117]|uniref:G-protein coupled receptors family 3 profile domain-containing protein n=1 Tax=Spizellomyces punctatus (strain DAOM BR117) TaxID=645134 RepID=A0A0L0HDC3_SPIPD|nr:uncharacterized protein SPPG_06396 [Spizellomyces punctatus DAOM BR117]KNC98718.1 hypothetical protein SPPG_06396 [Spizellomyces punctatus DAOM BR117]|eukprot:XP_016606758.1 hypothetical protein SPPG_06396 [Spizellomyces punctatus DAOM BR117]